MDCLQTYVAYVDRFAHVWPLLDAKMCQGTVLIALPSTWPWNDHVPSWTFWSNFRFGNKSLPMSLSCPLAGSGSRTCSPAGHNAPHNLFASGPGTFACSVCPSLNGWSPLQKGKLFLPPFSAPASKTHWIPPLCVWPWSQRVWPRPEQSLPWRCTWNACCWLPAAKKWNADLLGGQVWMDYTRTIRCLHCQGFLGEPTVWCEQMLRRQWAMFPASRGRISMSFCLTDLLWKLMWQCLSK